MEDGYECEGQMNIFEFLDKEQELDDSWNKWPDKIPQERGKWYKLLLKYVFPDGMELVVDGRYHDKTLIGEAIPERYRCMTCKTYWRYKENYV